MSVKTIVYDGLKYWELEMEPILINGEESGHYKEINRKHIIINGIFDDETVRSEVINFINDMHKKCQSEYYILESQAHYETLNADRAYLFSSYSLSPEYNSLGEAIIGFMIDLGWIVDSWDIKTFIYQGEEIDIIYFHYDSDNINNNFWKEAYLFPVSATTFNSIGGM